MACRSCNRERSNIARVASHEVVFLTSSTSSLEFWLSQPDGDNKRDYVGNGGCRQSCQYDVLLGTYQGYELTQWQHVNFIKSIPSISSISSTGQSGCRGGVCSVKPVKPSTMTLLPPLHWSRCTAWNTPPSMLKECFVFRQRSRADI